MKETMRSADETENESQLEEGIVRLYVVEGWKELFECTYL